MEKLPAITWGAYAYFWQELNQRNPAVKEYIADVIRFWVREFDIDGIRLDAADVLDFEFMHMLRAVANEVKADFYLMGEVIHGEYNRWVNEGTLHAVTNYHLHKALYSGNELIIISLKLHIQSRDHTIWEATEQMESDCIILWIIMMWSEYIPSLTIRLILCLYTLCFTHFPVCHPYNMARNLL